MPMRQFIGKAHTSTNRDYLARASDPNKAEKAKRACQWGYDYWDNPDRTVGYGGYHYDGRHRPIAEAMVAAYGLKAGMRVLDVGAGKGFLLHDLREACPGLIVSGLDVSSYAIADAKPEVIEFLIEGDAGRGLPWPNRHFDLVVSINCLHNLEIDGLFIALREINRVSRGQEFVCVESYLTEQQKWNLMSWQLTCQSFFKPDEWRFVFDQTGYQGDYEFIYFD